MDVVLAIVLGAAFGATLDRIGATSPTWIGKMLSLVDLHLMKTILLGIGTASVLMFGGQMLGLVEVGHMSVKTVYVGVFVGGLLLGAGWAASGYCPGTGVCAAASGRLDALSFVVGGLLGAAAYMVTFPMWEESGLLEGAKLTLGVVPEAGYEGLLGVRGDIVGIALGALFVALAFVLPQRLRGSAADAPGAQPVPAGGGSAA